MDYPTKYTIRLPDNEALLLRHTAFHQGKSPTAKATELLSKAIQEDCFDEEEEPPPLLQEHLHAPEYPYR